MAVQVVPYSVYPGGSIPPGIVVAQPGAKLKLSRDGVAVFTETFKGNGKDLLISSVAAQESVNGTYPSLQIWSVVLTQGQGGVGVMEVESRGLNPALGGPPDPIYSLERATSNEPLATHPLWATQIAGTPAAPLNGAIFVDAITNQISATNTAIFKGWSGDSIFRGVEDYLCAGATWSSSYVAYGPPDLGGVGSISTPEGPAPSEPTGYFWFFAGASCSRQGSVYRVQKTWKLSGGVINAVSSILYGGG